jgi:L-malate glycosyltransferase
MASKSTMAEGLSILHVSTELGWRGGEQQIKLLTDGLTYRGHRCIVFTPGGSALHRDRTQAGLARALNLRFGEFDLLAARRIEAAARDIKIDLIHAHTSHAHALSLRAARQLNIPLIVSRRVDFPVGGNWLSRRKYFARNVRYIAISEAVKKVLLAAGIPQSHVAVVYSGVNPERFGQRGNDRDENAAKQWGCIPGQWLIVNIAALTDHKDQTTLLHAAALLRDKNVPYRLVIAGSGELESKLKMQQRDLRLEEHVQFAGYVKDTGWLLRAADIFVMSSHMEGLCTSILDAMAVGVPVVATNTGGIPEIVTHGKNGLLSRPRDPAGLAASIQQLMETGDLRHLFHHSGRHTVMERFTNDRMVDGTIQVYQDILCEFARLNPNARAA